MGHYIVALTVGVVLVWGRPAEPGTVAAAPHGSWGDLHLHTGGQGHSLQAGGQCFKLLVWLIICVDHVTIINVDKNYGGKFIA